MAGEHNLRYAAIYAAVFATALYAAYSVPPLPAETFTAQMVAWVLASLGHKASWTISDSQATLTLLGDRAITVAVIRECTALNVVGVMAGLILPLHAPVRRRLLGVALSALMLFSLNIPRIALTVYLAAYNTPLTLLVGSSIDAYHYPISFVFGVLGVVATVLLVSYATTPELAGTLTGVAEELILQLKRSFTVPTSRGSS